eukprot:935100-Rhodomonas_salina.3
MYAGTGHRVGKAYVSAVHTAPLSLALSLTSCFHTPPSLSQPAAAAAFLFPPLSPSLSLSPSLPLSLSLLRNLSLSSPPPDASQVLLLRVLLLLLLPLLPLLPLGAPRVAQHVQVDPPGPWRDVSASAPPGLQTRRGYKHTSEPPPRRIALPFRNR